MFFSQRSYLYRILFNTRYNYASIQHNTVSNKHYFIGTVTVLKRLAARQELRLAEAANFVEKPHATETLYPFVETWAPAASLTSRKRSRDETDDETSKGSATNSRPTNTRFSPNNNLCHSLIKNSAMHSLFLINMQNKFWQNSAQKLTSLALSSNTWHKYFAAYKKLNNYLDDTKQTLRWPLEQRVINGFILWCKERDSIKPQSVKAYIFGLSKIQKFLGFSKIQFSKTYTEDLLTG
jgi:hypothetical protein